MGIPRVGVELQTGGWILGDPVRSILGQTTYLGYRTFVDVMSSARRVSIRRGRQHELTRTDAGTATVVLRNPSADFDPTNVGSPYWPDVRPMSRMRLTATWQGVTYPLLTGYADSWQQAFTPTTSGDSRVTLGLVDGFKALNLDKVTGTFGFDWAGNRIDDVLDAVDWPAADRRIDTGGGLTVAAATVTDTAALSYLQTVADSDSGVLFMTADGKVAFYNRDHAYTLDTVNDVWGDVGVEKDYADIKVAHDDGNIWNVVQVTAPGVPTVEVEDVESQGKYFRRVLNLSTLNQNYATAAVRAADLLAAYKEPATRITTLNLEGRGDDSQWARILSKDLHDQVRVIKRPPGGGTIEQDSFIEGISHDIAGNSWTVSWALSPA